MPSILSIDRIYPSSGSSLVFEGQSGVRVTEFRITRTGDLSGPATIGWAAIGTGDTLAGGDDFEGGALPSGRAYFAPGIEYVDIAVRVQGDTTFEPFETYALTLSNPAGDAGLGQASAVGEIYSDDHTMALRPTSISQVEGDEGATVYTFEVDYGIGGYSSGFAADWYVVGSGDNPADAADFVGGVLPSGSVGYSSRNAQRQFTVAVVGDNTTEGDETFKVVLRNSRGDGLILLDTVAQGTIRNDDPAPVTASEPAQQLSWVTVDLSSTTAQVVRLYRATLDRLPEQSGVAYYRDLLDRGVETLHTLVDNFTGSPEFVERYGRTTDEDFVELLYRNTLGREGSVSDVD